MQVDLILFVQFIPTLLLSQYGLANALISKPHSKLAFPLEASMPESLIVLCISCDLALSS